MSHVDEGTLHALVDDQLDAAERSAVEAHLASCGDCARRFAEATAMARQVVTLLGALDAPMQPVRIVAPSPSPVIAPSLDGGATVTPIRRRMVTLRRVAIAASVMLVAGVSYQVGKRGDAAPLEAPARAERSRSAAVPMRAAPSVVDGAADSFIATPPPSVRAKPSGGPRADADGGIGPSAAAPGPRPVVALAPVPMSAPAPQGGVARREQEAASTADRAEPAAEQRRVGAADAQSAGQARTPSPSQAATPASSQVSAQVTAQTAAQASERSRTQSVAQAPAPSMQRPVVMSQPATKVSAAAREVVAPAGAAAGNAQPAAPKTVPLAGYVSVEEASVPAMTRRRYVSTAGTTIELSIIQSFAAPKRQVPGDASQFVVTTANGRSSVRWQVGGMDYLLQGPLPPDSLVKLATQLKP